jgi:AraC-like DNA-binding protein
MMLSEFPFSLEIPVRVGRLSASFFVTENLYAQGEQCISKPHNHGSHYEIRYLIRGGGIQTIGEHPVKAEKGELILIYPGEYHYQSRENCSADLAQYNLRFLLREPTANAKPRDRKAYGDLVSALKSFRLGQDRGRRLENPFSRLLQEIHRKEAGYFYNIQALCTVIFTELIRLLPESVWGSVFPAEELRYNGYWRVRIDGFLSNRYADPIRLQDLADAINLSKRQTERLLQKEYGMGYSQKLLETRLQFAKYQLQHTDKSIQQVAYDCGFQSYGYFLNCFRKVLGSTPQEIKKRESE